MKMLRSKPELLFLFLVVHQGNWFCGNVSGSVPVVVESQVKSWVVERRSSPSYDGFTVNMKPTFRCYHEWCIHRFKAFPHATPMVGNRTCRCECTRNDGFASFLPSVRSCINASMAASFAGCQKYFKRSTLLDTPIDLTKSNNDQTFRIRNSGTCNLDASYFHDYAGLKSNWQLVADGFFKLVKKDAKSYSVQVNHKMIRTVTGFLTSQLVEHCTSITEWQPDMHRMLSGRIIRLNVTCGASTGCFLFKALGSVIYNASSPRSSSSTTSSLPSISSSLSSSSSPSLSSSSSVLPALLLKPTSSYSTSKTLTIPSTEPSWVTPTSTAAFTKPGSKESQIKEKGSGALIGAAVGSTLLAGAVFLVLLICWRKQKARESSRKEKKQVEVGNPVYGISNNEFQMEKVKGSAQDGQQRYQDPSNTGQSVGATVYSNPDSNYDNCAVYQSLEKPTPGSPVYQSLEEQIPESSVYESLNSDQDKPSGRAALKNVSPKQSTLQNPKSSASGQLNPTAKGLGFTPNPKERGSTERGIPNTYSTLTQKPSYNVCHEADAGQETTPGALYVDPEGPTSGQDYETLNGDDEHLASIETNAQIGFESPCARKDQVYVELEGPDAQNGPEDEPSNAQEPLYNMLEDPNEGKSPKVEPSNSSLDPLYNVLEELDSNGSKKPEPVRGHYNPAYEQTLDFGHPYATSHRPGAQTESVYEPLRRASTLDP